MKRFCNKNVYYFSYINQAIEFEKQFGRVLSDDNNKILGTLINSKKSIISRFKLILKNLVYKYNWLDNLIFKILILFKIY